MTISLLNGKVLAATDAAGNAKISGLAKGTHKVVASTADGLTVPAVATIVVKDPQAAQDKVSMSVADPNGKTYLPRTSYDFVSGETVYSLLTKSGLHYEAKYYGMYGGYYVQKIEGLGEFDKGAKSGWMYRVNGVYPEVSCSEYKLRAGDDVEWLYTTDLGKDIGASSEQKTDVTTSGAEGSGITTAPTEVKVTEKTNADGTKTKVAEVKVSADNQKEILKQAKANKSKQIILNVASKAVGDAIKAEVTLDKSFIDSIVKDTDAKLTVKTPFGDKTYTQDELKALSAAATGSTVTITVEKAAEETADDAVKAEKIAKAKVIAGDMKLVARSSKTAKKNVKVTLKAGKATSTAIKELKDLGFTAKYRFYRSTRRSAGYKQAVTKKTANYTNTSGKKGTKYFYKIQVRVYDEKGKLVVTTALKQCTYASRTWTR